MNQTADCIANSTRGQDVLDAHLWLGRLHLADPALALWNAVAWLSPSILTAEPPEDDNDDVWLGYDEGDDIVLYTMLMCHDVFPWLFDEAMEALRAGEEYEALYWRLVRGVSDEMWWTEIEELEQIPYGIPLRGWGADLNSPFWLDEFMDHRTFLLLEAMGIKSTDEWESKTVAVERALCRSLLAFPEEHWPDPRKPCSDRERIGWAFAWLFSITGHDLADYSEETLYSGYVDLPDWTLENVIYFEDLHQSSAAVYARAQEGLEIVNTNPEWAAAILHNWTHLKGLIEHGRIPSRRSCRWPDAAHRRSARKAKNRT